DKSQLGDSNATQSTTAIPVSGVANAVQVAASADHTCALLATGEVFCWGDNSRGALANPAGNPIPLPVPVNLPQKAAFLGAGYSHNCVLLEDHSVMCWGDNSWGQIDGTPVSATKS